MMDGLDVPVNHPSTMGFRETARDLKQDVSDKGVSLTTRSEKPGKIRSGKIFHD